MNPGSLASHKKWATGMCFNFPVASDPDRAVCRAYGVLKENGTSVMRTVYIVDRTGVIRFAREGLPSTEEILQIIDSL